MDAYYGYYYDSAKIPSGYEAEQIYINAQYICSVTDIRSATIIEELQHCNSDTEKLLFILSKDIQDKLKFIGSMPEVI